MIVSPAPLKYFNFISVLNSSSLRAETFTNSYQLTTLHLLSPTTKIDSQRFLVFDAIITGLPRIREITVDKISSKGDSSKTTLLSLVGQRIGSDEHEAPLVFSVRLTEGEYKLLLTVAISLGAMDIQSIHYADSGQQNNEKKLMLTLLQWNFQDKILHQNSTLDTIISI